MTRPRDEWNDVIFFFFFLIQYIDGFFYTCENKTQHVFCHEVIEQNEIGYNGTEKRRYTKTNRGEAAWPTGASNAVTKSQGSERKRSSGKREIVLQSLDNFE